MPTLREVIQEVENETPKAPPGLEDVQKNIASMVLGALNRPHLHDTRPKAPCQGRRSPIRSAGIMGEGPLTSFDLDREVPEESIAELKSLIRDLISGQMA